MFSKARNEVKICRNETMLRNRNGIRNRNEEKVCRNEVMLSTLTGMRLWHEGMRLCQGNSQEGEYGM